MSTLLESSGELVARHIAEGNCSSFDRDFRRAISKLVYFDGKRLPLALSWRPHLIVTLFSETYRGACVRERYSSITDFIKPPR